MNGLTVYGCIGCALVVLVAPAFRGVANAEAPNGSPPPATASSADQDGKEAPGAPGAHWAQGHAVVNAPPDVVWARLQQVDSWPAILTDIARMKVTAHNGAGWTIELETKTLDHGMLPYNVTLEPEKRVRMWARAPGIAVQAFTFVRPGPTPAQSDVVYSLYIKTSWVVGLLISDKNLQEKQKHMVAVTLSDLQHAFASTSYHPGEPAR